MLRRVTVLVLVSLSLTGCAGLPRIVAASPQATPTPTVSHPPLRSPKVTRPIPGSPLLPRLPDIAPSATPAASPSGQPSMRVDPTPPPSPSATPTPRPSKTPASRATPVATVPARPTPSASATPMPDPTEFGQPVQVLKTVPRSMFGMHVPWALPSAVELNGNAVSWPGEWPTVKFSALRLWDTKTAWVDLEPERDQFTFTTLDALIDKANAHGITDITLVLGGTPTWAATAPAPGSAPWIGPDAAAVPADETAWTEYVGAVASRYKGRIAAYEVWNEPNSRLFWQGSPAQIARLSRLAAAAIRGVDPGATVIAPSLLLSDGAGVGTAAKWLRAFERAGWAADVAGVHLYPSPAGGAATFADWASAYRDLLASHGWDGPVWATEASYLDRSGVGISAHDARLLVTDTYQRGYTAGLARVYWYAWSPAFDDSLRSIVLLQPGSPGAQGYANAWRSARR